MYHDRLIVASEVGIDGPYRFRKTCEALFMTAATLHEYIGKLFRSC